MTHPPTIMLLLVTLLLSTTAATATVNRRLLHQPFFQLDQPVPSISLPPSPSPQPQPKYPFSTLSPPTATTTPQNPFFPSYPYSPPPPVPPSATATTFPANISSIVLPSSSSPHSFHRTIKLISLVLSLSVFSFLLLAALIFLLFRHHRRPLKADTVHLFPANIPPSDASKNPPPPTFPRHKPACTSSEFLYLGTLVSSRDADNVAAAATQKDKEAPPAVSYLRLGSPDLHPLPPLPRQHSQQIYDTKILNSPINKNDDRSEGNGEEENEEFFSPRWSTVNVAGPYSTTLSPPLTTDFVNGRSLNSSNSCSPSVVLNYSGSLKTTELSSPDSLSDFPAPLPRFTIPPPPARDQIAFSTFSPSSTEDCSSRASDFSDAWKVPPPAPSPPLARVWETAPAGGPPELVGPSRKAVNRGKGSFGNSGDIGKPKLKPLDKVRASTDGTRVWDHFKFSSIQLNEEMIETLFTVSSPTKSAKVGAGRQIIPDVNQECLVLGPKKSQNIAILLRALNVTIEEVCEALTEGNADTLGNELLESLLKMAPTKDEERKLKDFKDDTPTFLLGTAETFLKAVIDIPFAFQRVDAMLYIANFDSEVEYLKRCFSTLGCACKELKSSRIFLKLLEAALRIGNQMNVGINEGDVQAFKLDSLVKLVDIKGTDGKTTLLHFVVQEIISTEGSCLSQSQQSTLRDEVEFRKVGLQVVSGLNGELTNVKKAATMDADLLTKDVSKLATGVTRITQVLKLNEEVLSVTDKSRKFADSMNEFLNKAEGEIVNIQAQEGIALSMVKGLTEYFHGDSNKEEAHPFRLFVVVRDFLRILDQVCKDVAKINERTMVRSGRQIEATAIPVGSQVFSS